MKCCICAEEIPVEHVYAGGHNAEPVRSGRCCGFCNSVIVIPTRLGAIDAALGRKSTNKSEGDAA